MSLASVAYLAQSWGDAQPPDQISPDAARRLFLALNHLVAVLRTPDDPEQSGALAIADRALAAARGR